MAYFSQIQLSNTRMRPSIWAPCLGLEEAPDLRPTDPSIFGATGPHRSNRAPGNREIRQIND
uniref:Uncharacterized protein n=1 Tax=Nymphaea colorata TaxID=210225 RepID=A0A5K0WZX5_9MAGN